MLCINNFHELIGEIDPKELDNLNQPLREKDLIKYKLNKILKEIFSLYLTLKERATVRLVCKNWAKSSLYHESKIYQILINSLLKNSQVRVVDFNIDSSNQENKKYSISFNRSYGWASIYDRIDRLKLNDGYKTNAAYKEWVDDCLKKIEEIYGIKNRLYQFPLDVVDEVKVYTDFDFDKLELLVLNEQINQEGLEIVKLLKDLKTKLAAFKDKIEETIEIDSTLKEEVVNKTRKAIMLSIHKHWDGLALLADWLEIAMNSDELFFKINNSPDPEKLNISDSSTKAIFVLSESTELKIQNKDNDPQVKIQIIVPKKLELHNETFGTSPFPNKSGQIRGSMTLNLSTDNLDSQALLLTSEAKKLSRLVLKALDKINEHLKSQTTSKKNSISILGGISGGIKWFVPIIFPPMLALFPKSKS